MVAKPPLKSLRRSTNTRLGLPSCLARCWPQSRSSPCSSRRLSSFSKRRKRRSRSLRPLCRTLIKVCHLRKTRRWNGSASSATASVGIKRLRIVASARPWRLSSRLLVSRLRPCPVLTVTCHPTSRSHAPTASSPPISLASPVLRCATSPSLIPRKSSIDSRIGLRGTTTSSS